MAVVLSGFCCIVLVYLQDPRGISFHYQWQPCGKRPTSININESTATSPSFAISIALWPQHRITDLLSKKISNTGIKESKRLQPPNINNNPAVCHIVSSIAFDQRKTTGSASAMPQRRPTGSRHRQTAKKPNAAPGAGAGCWRDSGRPEPKLCEPRWIFYFQWVITWPKSINPMKARSIAMMKHASKMDDTVESRHQFRSIAPWDEQKPSRFGQSTVDIPRTHDAIVASEDYLNGP